MERAPSLEAKNNTAPKDMSNLSNYTSKQLTDMAKAEQNESGKTFGGFGKQNVADNTAIAKSLKESYLRQLQSSAQNYSPSNISSRGVQGHASPFDTALDRYSPNVAPHINF